MFQKNVYIQRRSLLKNAVDSGIIFFPGNSESPVNYRGNDYPFRQDSTFLYYWGLDIPGLAAVIDIDENREIIFGDDAALEDIIWTGPQEKLEESLKKCGVDHLLPLSELPDRLMQTTGKGREVHYLPQYRSENIILMADALNRSHRQINEQTSKRLIEAVIRQRLIKSSDEITEIKDALRITGEMYHQVMKRSRPGLHEPEIASAAKACLLANGTVEAFPPIITTRGERLHGHKQENLMQKHDLLLMDSGAESHLHYASDITRTMPVGGRFTDVQKDIYQIVLDANERSISAARAGNTFLEVHLRAATVIADGLIQIGLMKGDADKAVAAGAHALFFPHGIGHPMGLDVHDMESLGEDNVGYGSEALRSDQFGLAYLRFARTLTPGMVLTIEPGVYFIPELIRQWQNEGKFPEFINYNLANQFLDFGGIRIEDDIVIGNNAPENLSAHIPKSIKELEETCSGY